MSNKITAYVIAYNEADKIADCLNTIQWVDEILLIDSNSTDGTIEIAESLGARVIQVPFNGYGDLRNQALGHCTGDWIFSLDSDERCTEEARDEILTIVRSEAEPAHDVYNMPRRNYFMGRAIKYSGWFPNYRQPQLFKNGALTYTQEVVHEGYNLNTEKPLGHLTQAIWQVPFKNLQEKINKMNRYSSLNVEKLKERNKKASMPIALGHGMWAFIRLYIIRLGFLDGWPGFIIALGNFEGTFYRYAKLVDERTEKNYPEVKPIK